MSEKEVGSAVKRAKRQLTGLLLTCCLLALCGCGGAAPDLGDLPQAYAQQGSVQCSMTYTVKLDAVIDGTEYTDLKQACTLEAQVDLGSGACKMEGEMTALLDNTAVPIEVEAYGDRAGSYYRYGDRYSYSPEGNAFLTAIQAPLALNLSGYRAQNAAEIVNGSPCTGYTGTEIADDSPQRWIGMPEPNTFSLEGCLVDVTLYVYDATGLPACLLLDYSNLEDMDICLTDGAGNQYTITALSYEVLYQTYGAQVSVAVPDDFRQAAMESAQESPAEAGPGAEAEAGAETGGADADAPSSGEPAGDGLYAISDQAGSYRYEIETPEYMALEDWTGGAVSFYYAYAAGDLEEIRYTICEDCSDEEEAAYAKALPDYYASVEGISGVTSDGLQSLTLDGRSIRYLAVYLTLEQDGAAYEVVDVYSWVVVPNGSDCLEVCITEYNGSGDGTLIDPEEELAYAYGAIQGCRQS